MLKFVPFVMLSFVVACGGGSRVDECEVDGCDATVIEACKTSVEACETAGGPNQATCVDGVVRALDVCADDGENGDDDDDNGEDAA